MPMLAAHRDKLRKVLGPQILDIDGFSDAMDQLIDEAVTALGSDGPLSYFPTAVLRSGTAAKMQAAQNAKTAAGGGPITVLGAQTLEGNVYSDLANLWLFQGGASFTGAGQLDAMANSAVMGQAGLTLARLLGGSGASHVMSIQARAAALTGATASTESTGLLISLVNNRPSDYPGSKLHDVVNLELQQIGEGSTTLRMHGLSVGVGPGAGADGYVVPIEGTSINNSGIDSGTLGANNSKIGIHSVAFGNAATTAAFVSSAGDVTLMPNAKFLDAFVAVQESIVTGAHAFGVRPLSTIATPKTRADDVAWIGRDGDALFSRQISLFSDTSRRVRKTILKRSLTAASGNIELTMDGAAPSASNTLQMAANTVLTIKPVRYVIRCPNIGWTGVYLFQETLASRGASTVSLAPSAPTASLVAQIGSTSANFAFNIYPGTGSGRPSFYLLTDSSETFTVTAEVETVESV